MLRSLVGSEMCIRDSHQSLRRFWKCSIWCLLFLKSKICDLFYGYLCPRRLFSPSFESSWLLLRTGLNRFRVCCRRRFRVWCMCRFKIIIIIGCNQSPSFLLLRRSSFRVYTISVYSIRVYWFIRLCLQNLCSNRGSGLLSRKGCLLYTSPSPRDS